MIRSSHSLRDSTKSLQNFGNSILKNKSVNYGVFHYFGDQNFVYFLEQLLSFVFIIVPVLDVGKFDIVFSHRKSDRLWHHHTTRSVLPGCGYKVL
jgi:hypothetical protein